MQSVVRVKYRPAAVQPEMNEVSNDAFKPAARRKVKADAKSEVRVMDSGVDFSTPTMFPGYTQRTTVCKVIYSDEAKYRTATTPTMFERVQAQKKWAEMQVMEARRNALHEKMLDTLYETANNLKNAGDSTQDLDLETGGGEDDDVFGVLDEKEMDIDQQARSMQLEIVGLKERRFTRSRNTKVAHVPVHWRSRYSLSIGLWLGHASATRSGATEITPWLYLGSRDTASDMAGLVSMGK